MESFTTTSPSRIAAPYGIFPSASATSGKTRVRSLPLREISLAAPLPASPSSRYPSYLISKTHPVRENGASHGSAFITCTTSAVTTA